MSIARTYRAGSSIEDYCRACKTDRIHTVVAADLEGRPIRVMCGYCRSEHNFRGGGRMPAAGETGSSVGTASGLSSRSRPAAATMHAPESGSPPRPHPAHSREPWPTVSDRERSAPPVSVPDATTDLEQLLRRIIREEAGVTAAAPADRWRDGSLVLRPGTPGLQERSWPIETFFHKIVMLRNRLRTLEQQLNASDLPDDAKVKMQSYITGCYGSLTSFNVLFADEDDQFKGSGGDA